MFNGIISSMEMHMQALHIRKFFMRIDIFFFKNEIKKEDQNGLWSSVFIPQLEIAYILGNLMIAIYT